MERNSRNVVATLETISRDPETLLALQVLLVQLLQADTTRHALVQLLLAAFADPELCAATGAFLLASLDTTAAQAELRRQAAALASATVADEQVSERAAMASAPPSQHAHPSYLCLRRATSCLPRGGDGVL
jgi:hypothetical protein